MSVKTVLFDVETTPLIVHTWGLWGHNVPASNIIQDRQILCVAWKTLGERRVGGACRSGAVTERAVIEQFREAIDDADILVGHNVDGFDVKHVNAKIIEYGLPPMPKLHTVDTLKEVRKVAKFSSNRLDFLGDKLVGQRKQPTDMQLWKDCMDGDEAALARMFRYCKNDVTVLEALYLKLRPYMRNHPNVADNGSMNCPRCNGELARLRKAYRTKAGIERAHVQCLACNAPFTISPAKANRPLSSV